MIELNGVKLPTKSARLGFRFASACKFLCIRDCFHKNSKCILLEAVSVEKLSSRFEQVVHLADRYGCVVDMYSRDEYNGFYRIYFNVISYEKNTKRL